MGLATATNIEGPWTDQGEVTNVNYPIDPNVVWGPNNGYYYLLGSRGLCCSGVNSTYYTVVGRSTSITGPYLDENGVDLNSGGGTTILTGAGAEVAGGGADIFDFTPITGGTVTASSSIEIGADCQSASAPYFNDYL
jgi:arabinan endo-1,5-alpha-L-arabinosidase